MQHPSKLVLLFSISLLITACEGGEAQARADSVAGVVNIHVQAESCRDGIQAALAERGLGVAETAGQADAILEVKIVSEGRNLQDIPEFGGFGSKASYNAKLYGADDSVLFSTVGEEGSLTYVELCEDIGDELADRIKEKKTT